MGNSEVFKYDIEPLLAVYSVTNHSETLTTTQKIIQDPQKNTTGFAKNHLNIDSEARAVKNL